MHSAVYVMAQCLCLSVLPSVTRQYRINTSPRNECRMLTLVFWWQRSWWTLNSRHSQIHARGVKYTLSSWICSFQLTTHRQYTGWSHMYSIKRSHCSWTPVTLTSHQPYLYLSCKCWSYLDGKLVDKSLNTPLLKKPFIVLHCKRKSHICT